MLEAAVYFKNLFLFFKCLASFQFFQHQEGGRKGSIYMTQRPSERLRVTQILSGGVEILNHKDFFFFFFLIQRSFCCCIYLPGSLTRGRIWLCRKRRPSFRRGGNSNLRYPDLGEPVLALIFILKKKKKKVRNLVVH